MSPLFPAVRQLLRWQLWAMLTAVSIAYLYGAEPFARSAALGAAIAILPNAYFAYRAGSPQPDKSAQDIVRGFYFGETVKLIATAVLFAVVLQLPGLKFPALFGSFIAVLMTFWFALLVNTK